MKQTASTFYIALLFLCLVTLFAACQPNAASPNVGSSQQAAPTLAEATASNQAVPTVPEATASNDTESSTATSEAPPSAGACSIVSVEELQDITGVMYDSTTTQGDFPNIKHCDYRGQTNTVSWVLANGPTATMRMTQNKLLPHTPIAGFQDEAIWEPVQNLLSVASGGNLVEVRISKSHGDEATRIEQAKELALLLFSRASN